MRRPARHTGAALAALAAAIVVAACSNPDRPGLPIQSGGPQNQGEPAAPAPPAGAAAAGAQATPQAAIEQYARLYVNWSWRSLPADQRRLAAISVGQARITDRQAAAQTEGDATLRRARLSNCGVVVAIAADRQQAGEWVVVTRERTSGSGEYEALPASFHITLARVQRVRGGWAVSQWAPQL